MRGRAFCKEAEPPRATAFINPTYLVHFGNVVALAALSQSDMLYLRCLLAVSTTCGISYNLLQPKPLIPPAIWGCAFLSLHAYMIVMLLREREQLKLSSEEELVYEKAFLPYGFTPRQFRSLLESSQPRWCSWGAGDYVRRKGDDMAEVHYLVEGEAEVLSSTDDLLHKIKPGKGGWLGEFFDPNAAIDHWDAPRKLPISYRCTSERCQTLALDRSAMHRSVKGSPQMEQAAVRAAVSDVWGKLHRVVPDMRRSAYRSMLEVALVDGGLDAAERKMLAEYRQRHKIGDDVHQDVLRDVGWTTEEFAAGRKGSARRATWFRQ